MDIKTKFSIDDIVDVLMSDSSIQRAKIDFILIKVNSANQCITAYDVRYDDSSAVLEWAVAEDRISLVPRIMVWCNKRNVCTLASQCQAAKPHPDGKHSFPCPNDKVFGDTVAIPAVESICSQSTYNCLVHGCKVAMPGYHSIGDKDFATCNVQNKVLK